MYGKKHFSAFYRPNVCCQGGCINPVDAAVPHWVQVTGIYCDYHKKMFNYRLIEDK
jgi:hypothetical protein